MKSATFVIPLLFSACAVELDELPPEDDIGTVQSSLSAEQRRTRAGQIRDAALGSGITQGYLLAGIADAETTMAHCHSELTWACRGPHSADCGGPVVAGAGDGPCSLRQGGIGMFQFDAGTYEQTLAREGSRILSIAGNVEAAVDFVVNMVIRSSHIAGVSNRPQAIDWINGVRIGNGRWDAWIRTVTHYYNGCPPGAGCFPGRYARYRDHTSNVHNEMGAGFWAVSLCEPRCVDGRRIESASCDVGDCGAFGARCVDDALGARCVSVFCEARGEDHGCLPDGDTIVTCRDGALIGSGQCSAFGARCVDDALGARCASVFCDARGEHSACLDDDTILSCRDGALTGSGRCSAYGATCVDDALGARCVSVFCDPRGAAKHCIPDSDVIITCEDGGIAGSGDCSLYGADCVEDELGARCVSVFCEPVGDHEACIPGDVAIECTDGGIASSTNCADEGGVCVVDEGVARCIGPDGEPDAPPVEPDRLDEPVDDPAPGPGSVPGLSSGCSVARARKLEQNLSWLALTAFVLCMSCRRRRRRIVRLSEGRQTPTGARRAPP